MRNKYFIGILALIVLLTGMAIFPREADTIETAVSQPQAMIPIVDAGHGEPDGGASSASGVTEQGINLAIALKTEAVFRFLGKPCILTRDTDSAIYDPDADTIREKKRTDLQNRVSLVNHTPNGVLLSIHQNIYPDTDIRGAQVFYRDGAQELASLTQDRLRAVLDPDNNRKAKQIPGEVYLMNHVNVPAILVECGFLSNPQEAETLCDNRYQTKLAVVLATGFMSWEQRQQTDSLYIR